MNKKILSIALAATTALTTATAFAEPNGRDNDPQQQQMQQDHRGHGPEQQRSQNDRQNQPRAQQDHRQDRGHEQRDHRADQPRYQQQRQAYRHDMPRPQRDWHKGQRIPAQYRTANYYVNDWKARELPAPPRNHRWVRVNGDYVLVAIATGVISSILLGGH